jgi:hypothetical protein
MAVLAAMGLAGAACVRRGACDGTTCAAACPRDSARDANGRCACVDGDVPILGACVPPPVADAFCGPAAIVVDSHRGASAGGCVFRACSAGAVLDVLSGACSPQASLRGSAACRDATLPIVESGRSVCVPPDATCPRGTRRAPGAATCTRPPGCPPGTLPDGSSCRSVVTAGGGSSDATGTRVDVGAWAALALGVDGGPGSHELCEPLTQRPSAFGPDVSSGPRTLQIAVSLTFPDQDISRVHALLEARDLGGHPLPPAADALVSADVSSLIELLRGLGGEASTAAVELKVRCVL